MRQSGVLLQKCEIELHHLGPAYVTNPWARLLETTFIYFPGGHDNSFMVVEFAQGRASLEQRWILPDPDVAALVDRHLQGLRPIGQEAPLLGTTSAPSSYALGVLVVAAIGVRLFGDRRRLCQKGRSAGKGTDRRSRQSSAVSG